MPILRVWKRLPLDRSIIHTRFHLFLENATKGKRVVKIPHGCNHLSAWFFYALREDDAFKKYKQLLFNIGKDPWMGKHCAEVFEVQRDGSYVSEFIEGYNMAHISASLFGSRMMPQYLRQELGLAVRQLSKDLRGYQAQHGHLIGDWELYNLVFSPKRGAIINVDAEGFFSYDKPGTATNLSYLENILNDVLYGLQLLESQSLEDKKTVDVLRILTEVRLGDKAYRGQGFLVGYQTLELNGKLFRGQRECSERLKKVPYDFDGKVVVDLGCNCGGMLHALSKTIKKGYGFDVDPKCISAAQAINVLNHTANLEFFTFDLDRDELSLLPCFLLHEKADICFLLSVCIWLKKWRMVVKQAATLADVLLYEANGTAEQQEEQVNELRRYFNKISLISDESLDDPTHHERKLYLCIDSKR